jgi:hypothetical protein
MTLMVAIAVNSDGDGGRGGGGGDYGNDGNDGNGRNGEGSGRNGADWEVEQIKGTDGDIRGHPSVCLTFPLFSSTLLYSHLLSPLPHSPLFICTLPHSLYHH